MPGIDRFLSESLEIAMKKDLDSETEYRMKRLMFEKHGLSIRQSIENIEKLLQIRQEILKESNYSQLKKYIKKICDVEKSSDGKFYKIKILDDYLKKSFMEKLGDNESRKIIMTTIGKNYPNSEVLALKKISTTSGYRKINILIRDGFLIKTKNKMIENRRSIEQYTTFCDKILFEIKKDELLLTILVNKKRLESSSIFGTLILT